MGSERIQRFQDPLSLVQTLYRIGRQGKISYLDLTLGTVLFPRKRMILREGAVLRRNHVGASDSQLGLMVVHFYHFHHFYHLHHPDHRRERCPACEVRWCTTSVPYRTVVILPNDPGDAILAPLAPWPMDQSGLPRKSTQSPKPFARPDVRNPGNQIGQICRVSRVAHFPTRRICIYYVLPYVGGTDGGGFASHIAWKCRGKIPHSQLGFLGREWARDSSETGFI